MKPSINTIRLLNKKIKSLLVFYLILTSVIFTSFAQDTIPFTLEKNKIFIKTRINNSDTLNFIFDTGADVCAVRKSIIDKKLSLVINDRKENIGFDGVDTVDVSSHNNISLGNNTYLSKEIYCIEIPDGDKDGIIGWEIFKNKIVEINYNLKKIIIKDNLGIVPDGFKSVKAKKIDNIYYVKIKLTTKDQQIDGWFDFDTGSDGSISLSNRFAVKYNLIGKMAKVAESFSVGSSGKEVKEDIVLLPKIEIANLEFYRTPITISTTKSINEPFNNNILGNNFLRRFNIIIDYRNETIYLKPNNFLYTPYYDFLIN